MKLNQINNRMGDFQVDIENLIDHFLGSPSKEPSCETERAGGWCPRVSLSESQDGYSLVMELAGVAAEDVSIEMQEGKLEVTGEKKADAEVEGVNWIKSERVTGEFRRAFDFATQVDADRIEAEFKDGLLTITLPKSAKVLPRQIEIKNVV